MVQDVQEIGARELGTVPVYRVAQVLRLHDDHRPPFDVERADRTSPGGGHLMPGALAVISGVATLLLALADQFDAVQYGLVACMVTSFWAFIDADRSVKRINKMRKDL